jgi:transposase
VADRNRAQKHVAQARIILHSAERLPVAEVAKRAGDSRPGVWRWQRRFAEAGVDGVLQDASRRPGKPLVPADVVRRLIALTCAAPPGEASHWTGRGMARAMGVSLRTVQRIWQTHRLQPHRIRTFKRSTDPDFAAKLEDVVGLYVAPPKHALVLSIDEKSQIRALDRTQPGLPLKPGKAGTITQDSVRNGTTILFAASNVLEGTVTLRCMQSHRHQELLRFLGTIERAVPADKLIHAILDNYGSHKHPKVKAWLAHHPRWTLHFMPKSGSWLNGRHGSADPSSQRQIRPNSLMARMAAKLKRAGRRWRYRLRKQTVEPVIGQACTRLPPAPLARVQQSRGRVGARLHRPQSRQARRRSRRLTASYSNLLVIV